MGKSASAIRAEINAKIIKALEAGTPPWVRPWRLESTGYHHNFRRPKVGYRGVNPWLLELSALSNGWTSTAWGTMKQWNTIDCKVKKGEHATWVIFWKRMAQKPQEDGEEVKGKGKGFFLLRNYMVFNACQVEATSELGKVFLAKILPPPAPEVPLLPEYSVAEHIVESCKADGLKIKHGGNRACWANGTENIAMPKRSQFKTDSHYFETLFHEMGHWTELARHTNWDRVKYGYAMGELRAEIICCYLTQHANIPHGEGLENHTAYIQTWLQKMREDDKWIFQATRFADQGADVILRLAGMAQSASSDEEEDSEPAKAA